MGGIDDRGRVYVEMDNEGCARSYSSLCMEVRGGGREECYCQATPTTRQRQLPGSVCRATVVPQTVRTGPRRRYAMSRSSSVYRQDPLCSLCEIKVQCAATCCGPR
ncbi:hypothetical protein BDZ85DRAFT_52503 [Elsinoe ampelina]|uniref:Uncharacterized protein n=1 Tax=Elsinoe ampelina TaxID=302913 RepID=A0A6A6GM83_9PEZI|nr:hypothetical protein BDZ85DRAFT_52503 [Elsinoe ampelina]